MSAESKQIIDFDDAVKNVVNNEADIHYRYSSVGQTFNNLISVVVDFNQNEVPSTDWGYSAGELTSLKDWVNLRVEFKVSTDVVTGANRAGIFVNLQRDIGGVGAWTDITGYLTLNYARTAGDGKESAVAVGFIPVLSTNDKLRVTVIGDAANTFTTVANASSISLYTVMGPKGDKGDTGADGDISWQGQWTAQNYVQNDTVQDNGSAWVCVQDTIANDPPPVLPATSNTYWELLVAKGDTGTPGAGSSVSVAETGIDEPNTPHQRLDFRDEFTLTDQANGTVFIENNNKGTSFPLSPADGRTFYRTDIGWNFTSNSTKGKWLSDAVMTEVFGRSGAQGNGYFRRINGSLQSAILGAIIPFDATIIAVGMGAGNSEPGTFEIREEGTVIFSTPLVGGAISLDDLDIDFSAGSKIQFSMVGLTNNMTSPQGLCYFKRRAT